jgi:hypothetical protein
MNKMIAGALCAGLLAIGPAGGALAGVYDTFQEVVGGSDFPPVTNERYRAECGGCHLAFPPRLLTAASWRDLIAKLKNHFGDDGTLAPGVTKELLDYLVANAAQWNIQDHTPFASTRAGANEAPPRLTETFFFTTRHSRQISLQEVKANPKVGSFANCAACHPNADKGNFSDHEVAIPGRSKPHG